MKLPVKIDLDWDQQKLDAFLKEKTKHGFLLYASILAHVLIEIPLGRPIFGNQYSVSDDEIKKIRKTVREADKLGVGVDQSLRSVILDLRSSGRPVDKKTAIICLWAIFAKRDGKIPWAMLVRLLKWFHKRLRIMKYGAEIYVRDDTVKMGKEVKKVNLGKEFKKLCMINKETTKEWIEERLYGIRRRDPDWRDHNIKTIVTYLRVFHLNNPQRHFFPRSINFSADIIEVEADYKDGDELKTLRIKRDFKTQELTEVHLNPSDARNIGSVTF